MDALSLPSIVVVGFFLGMRHATDADHVVAVSTIVSRHRNVASAALIGAFWGLGHTLTILAVGGSIVLLGLAIPARLGLSMELSVALMLIFLGILNLNGMLGWIADAFPTVHDRIRVPLSPGVQSDLHEHGYGEQISATKPHQHVRPSITWLDRHFGGIDSYQVVRPLLVGIVHGLAGSAAIALLVLATIEEPRQAIAYLVVFGIGTVAGMMLITAAIAVPIAHCKKLSGVWNPTFRIASGLLSLGFRLLIAYRIGFVDGLFTSHPRWTPQ